MKNTRTTVLLQKTMYDKGKEVQVIVMVKRNIMQIQSLPLQGGR